MFAGPAPPHCLRCIFYFEGDGLANKGAGGALLDTEGVSRLPSALNGNEDG